MENTDNKQKRLWKYAVIVSDTKGNLYVKDGDHRCETQEDVIAYAAGETTGKIRGLLFEDDILGVWDMTDHAKTIGKDPTVDVDASRGYDDEIRDNMPLKRKFFKNFMGKRSLELHPISEDYIKNGGDNWRKLLAHEWDLSHRNLLEDVMGRPVYIPLVLRPAQRYVIDKFQKLIDSNCKYINAGLCVRLGKTIISLEIAARNNFMPVYIGKNLTSQTSSKIDNDTFGIVPNLLTVSIHGGEKVKKIIDQIEAKNEKNLPILFVIDEVDDASHTKNSISTIKPIVEHFKSNGNLGCFITMSGTRIHRGAKVLNQISEDGFKEVLLYYHEMQILQPEVTCNRNFTRICFYDESNPDGLLNISDSLKCDTGRKDLVKFFKSILGDNNFEIESNDEFPHWFVKICANKLDNVGKLIKLLNKNCSVIDGQKYVYFAINGTKTKNKTAQKYCQNLIQNQENEGKICVFISQGMATTSFSVKGIGNSLVLTDNKLTADDVQALHRSATWAKGKDECNMVVVTTNGDEEYKYDDVFENEIKSDNPEDQKIKYKSFLNNNSITHIMTNGNSTHPVKIESKNVADYIDKKQKAMKSVNSLVSAIYGEDVDPELRESILTTVKSVISKSKKFKSGKPDSIESDSSSKDNKETSKEKSGKTSKKEIEITRQFVKDSIILPAIAKEQGIGIRDLSNLNSNLGVDLELFFDVYDSVKGFKYGIDLIYRDCDDRKYLRECIEGTMFKNDLNDVLGTLIP